MEWKKRNYVESAYSKLLRDPQWQKLRLEVLNRDEFTCQRCFDTTTTLHVHHKWYSKGKKPWEYPLEAFLTLCETCHHEETELRPESETRLLESLRIKSFLSADIDSISEAIDKLPGHANQEVLATIIAWTISDENGRQDMADRYFAHLKEKHPVAPETNPCEPKDA